MEPRLAQLEHNNRGKRPEKRPKQCSFGSHNGRIIVETCPHHHLFVAYATQKTIAEYTDFIRLLGKNLVSSLTFSRVFLHTTRLGKKIAMRPQFVQHARPQDESIQLVLRASKAKPFGT